MGFDYFKCSRISEGKSYLFIYRMRTSLKGTPPLRKVSIMVSFFRGDRTQILYKIAAIFSLVIIIITTSYGIIMSVFRDVEVVGQTFVDVEFPPIHVFPIFYMKPVTWLSFALVMLTYSGLELGRERIILLSKFKRSLIKIILFGAISLSTYEVLFNFTLWSGLIATDSLLGKLNPDIIINPFPNTKIPWNINFATKMYFSLTIVSVYSFYVINKIEREEKI